MLGVSVTIDPPTSSKANISQAVLMFHGVGVPGPGLPQDELPYWVSETAFDTIIGAVQAHDGGPEVVWTFDDGNASDVLAAEKLAAAGLVGKFYVLSGRIGKAGYLSTANIRAIDAMGMEIGLHGQDHIDWRHADDAVLSAELVDARDALADVVGKAITTLAIPFGAYNRRVMRRLARSDFKRIYTSDTGLARRHDRFARRNPVMAWHGATDVEAIIDDEVSLARRVRRSIAPFIKRTFR